MALGIELAYLLAMALSAACYGIFLVLYYRIVDIIFFRHKDSRLKKSTPFIIVTIMLIVATLHLGVSFDRTRTALISKGHIPGGALAFLKFTSTGSFMFQDSICAFQTLMADSFIVYRLYIVYAKDKRVVIPAVILFLGSAVTAIASLISEGLAEAGTSLFTPKGWITTYFTLTFVTNFSCTGLVAYKIWSMNDALSSMSTYIAVTVIESGALYSTLLLFTLVTYAAKDWSFFIPFLLLAQVVGIAFSLILIRVGLGISLGDRDTSSSTAAAPILTTIVSISSESLAGAGREPELPLAMVSRHGGLPHFGAPTTHAQTPDPVQTSRGTAPPPRYGLDTISERDNSNEKLPGIDYERKRGSHSSLSGGDLEEQKAAAAL